MEGHALAQEGVVLADVRDDCRRDVAVLNVRATTEDNGALGLVEEALDARRMHGRDDARERLRFLRAVGVEGLVPTGGQARAGQTGRDTGAERERGEGEAYTSFIAAMSVSWKSAGTSTYSGDRQI